MEFEEANIVLTREQVAAALYKHPMLPALMRGKLEQYKDVQLPSVVPRYGVLSQMFAAFTTEAETKDDHLRSRLQRAFDAHDMTVSANAITYKSGEVSHALVPRRAYWVEDATTTLPLKCHIADAISYMYTPAATMTSVTIENNFRKAVEGPAVPMFSRSIGMPEGWKHGDAIANSALQYSKLTDVTMVKAGALLHSVYQPLITSKLKTKEQLFLSIKTSTGDGLVPLPFKPLVIEETDMEKAWMFLSKHRQARGEDNKWISPLTSGYYIGGLPKPIANVFYQVVDIIHAAHMAKVSIIMFEYVPHSSVPTSLAANGFVVLIPSKNYMKFALPETKNVVPPGVYPYYRSGALEIARNLYLRIYSPPSIRPVITKLKVDFDVRGLSSLDGMALDDGPSMTWVFLQPDLRNYKVTYEPSVHAHAGHVIALSRVDAMSWDLKLLTRRFTAANGFKTWYPIAQARFIEFDKQRYKFVNLAIRSSVVIRVRELNKKKTQSLFGAILDMEEPLGEDLLVDIPYVSKLFDTVQIERVARPKIVTPAAGFVAKPMIEYIKMVPELSEEKEELDYDLIEDKGASDDVLVQALYTAALTDY